jgi:ribosomal protein S18 acetylase RimI-like enzyme
MDFVVTELDVSTWDVFAELVERNNGVFGGCWCTEFHAEGTARGIDRRAIKHQRVQHDQTHATLVLDHDGIAQGWCQWGSPDELPNIKHKRVYLQDPPSIPDWRITCFYVDPKHRGQGVARAALAGALTHIAKAGGGLVEAIPEVTTGREAQGRFLYSATVELFENVGFTRQRQVGKHAWTVAKTVETAA